MRVLVADDDPLCRLKLEEMLSGLGFEVTSVRDGAEAWGILQAEGAPRLAILDWVMPGLDGAEICRELRKTPRELYTYVILLTAKGAKEDAIMGLDAGADDYLVKPLCASELRVRLRTAARILELQERLIAGRESFRVKATYDPLTGLFNRAEILDRLREEQARSERMGTKLGVLLVDIDHFKEINDTHGHLVGDAVLREVTSRIRARVRPYDGVGRFGGDEFLLVLPGCDVSCAVNVAERLRASCTSRAIETSGESLIVTLSLGGTVGAGTTGGELEPILRAADDALYRSKRDGRNRVMVFAPGEKEPAVPAVSTGTWP